MDLDQKEELSAGVDNSSPKVAFADSPVQVWFTQNALQPSLPGEPTTSRCVTLMGLK